MSEFSLRNGSWAKGVIAAVLGGLKFLVIPLAVLIFTTSIITDAGGEQFINQLGFGDIMNAVVLVGIPITIASFFLGFYPKGSRSRLAFGLVVVALIGIWIWLVTRGGNIALEFEQFGLGLVITGLVLLFILAAGLKAVLYLAEYLSYRREWLSSARAPDQTMPSSLNSE